MNRIEADQNKTDLEALEALREDASELERIESLLNRFNVFEAIGFVEQETKHSRFLASLLDPWQNHGLGDALLRKLLDEASLSNSLDLRDKDLGQTLVQREWANVDILLTNDTHRFAVIIENKIWATEHSGQLSWYRKIVSGHHPGWQVGGIYLTPQGDAPSHEGYLPLDYGTVCEILEGILEDRGSALSSDVRVSIEQYVRMVRRRILGDPEIVSLCHEIYRKHKRAFDLVYKHRPDFRVPIRSVVEELIAGHPKLEQEDSSIDTLRFGVTDWDTPALLSAQGWTSTKRILMFVIYNAPDSLILHLFLGPGPEATRQRILAMVRANQDVFVEPRNTKARWISVYSRHLLRREAYEHPEDEEREREIRKRWAEFLEADLPRIDAALKREAWIWESVETDEAHSGSPSRFVWGEGDVEIQEPPEHEE